MSDYRLTAINFVRHLASGEFDAAHMMLSKQQQSEWPATALQEAYEEMVEDQALDLDALDITQSMEDWPDRRAGQVGWAHVALPLEDYGEAVAVVVVDENGDLRIDDIEWGRP